MKLTDAIVFLYVGFNLLFSACATFDIIPWWDKVYFLYQDTIGGGWLVWLSLYLLSVNPYRKTILPVLILSIVIFIWDITSYITGWGVNNPIATGVIFGSATLMATMFIIADLKWRLKDL